VAHYYAEKYARLEAQGFFWTTSEIDEGNAWFYNFGKGRETLHRQSAGEAESIFRSLYHGVITEMDALASPALVGDVLYVLTVSEV